MRSFAERLAIGDAHEKHVRSELEARGWTVDQWGQALLSESTREALAQTSSMLRFEPDIIASKSGLVVMIDCKASISPESGKRHLSRQAFEAGLAFAGERLAQFYFVFHDMSVVVPHELLMPGWDGPRNARQAYYVIPNDRCIAFDIAFGALPRIPLKAAA